LNGLRGIVPPPQHDGGQDIVDGVAVPSFLTPHVKKVVLGIRLLVAAGSDPHTRDFDGNSALRLAMEHDHSFNGTLHADLAAASGYEIGIGFAPIGAAAVGAAAVGAAAVGAVDTVAVAIAVVRSLLGGEDALQAETRAHQEAEQKAGVAAKAKAAREAKWAAAEKLLRSWVRRRALPGAGANGTRGRA
jgi:hypothetical protein